jgi:hypothetical protein
MFIEQPGAWGRNALLESRLPADVGAALAATAKPLGVRVVLIRRGARMASDHRSVYFARTDTRHSWVTHTFIDDPQELLEMDLEPLARGEHVEGSDPVDHPLYLVCTHGRHDTCCSIRGNAVSRLACNAYPAFSWECSHIGGDRFAANVVCFPHGIYYGRVEAPELIDLMESYGRGRLSLKHYRGRSCYPFDVQAAEYFLRSEHNLLHIDDVRLEDFQRDASGDVVAKFALPDARTAEVSVRRSLSERRFQLTCQAESSHPIPIYELLSCTVGD